MLEGQREFVSTVAYHGCHEAVFAAHQASYFSWGPCAAIGFGTAPGESGRVYTIAYAAKVSGRRRRCGACRDTRGFWRPLRRWYDLCMQLVNVGVDEGDDEVFQAPLPAIQPGFAAQLCVSSATYLVLDELRDSPAMAIGEAVAEVRKLLRRQLAGSDTCYTANTPYSVNVLQFTADNPGDYCFGDRWALDERPALRMLVHSTVQPAFEFPACRALLTHEPAFELADEPAPAPPAPPVPPVPVNDERVPAAPEPAGPSPKRRRMTAEPAASRRVTRSDARVLRNGRRVQRA